MLELRMRLRRNPEARALVDRRLLLISRANGVDGLELDRLAQEVQAVEAD